jgi:hypothetical protein
MRSAHCADPDAKESQAPWARARRLQPVTDGDWTRNQLALYAVVGAPGAANRAPPGPGWQKTPKLANVFRSRVCKRIQITVLTALHFVFLPAAMAWGSTSSPVARRRSPPS